jgi:hypothetical protein
MLMIKKTGYGLQIRAIIGKLNSLMNLYFNLLNTY